MFQEPYKIPVSVKGIVFENDKVWLRKNQRDEWELPGGKMDPGEQPEETCKREIKEELGFDIKVRNIIQAHLYNIQTSKDESHGVLVVTYSCKLLEKNGEFETISDSGHLAEFKLFSLEEIDSLNMPDFYKESIKRVLKK